MNHVVSPTYRGCCVPYTSLLIGCISEDSESLPNIDSKPNLLASSLGLRRRIKGYSISTDEELYSSDEFMSRITMERYEDSSLTCIGDQEPSCDFFQHDPLVFHPYAKDIVSLTSMAENIAASNVPLPLYTEKIKVPPDFSRGQQLLASCTVYGDLSLAQTVDHFEPIFRRLQQEWYQNGALVCSGFVFVASFNFLVVVCIGRN